MLQISAVFFLAVLKAFAGPTLLDAGSADLKQLPLSFSGHESLEIG